MRLLVFLFLLLSYPCAAQQIWVKVDQEGQGVLRKRGKECYVITPGHVVGKGSKGELVAEGRDRGNAFVEKKDLGGDVAILRVTSGLRCVEPWSSRQSKRGDGEARIRFVSNSGATTFVPVRVIFETDEWIKVTGVDGSNVTRQTMSGGTLEIEGRPAGMLIKVDPTKPTVVAMVMSQDYLTRIVSVFFDRKSQGTQRRKTSGEVNVRAEPSTRGKALELLDEGMEVDVIADARGGNWVKVKTDEGTEGYLRKTDLAKGS